MTDPSLSIETDEAVLMALKRLIEVVARLRSPQGGCPWDLEQTPQSLIPYVIEEAYEVVHALRSQDQAAIAEELGDLLLQVILQAQIAQEYDQFSLKEVAHGITEKLIRRHPHVFGEGTAQTVAEVREKWDQIKATEKGEQSAEIKSLSQKLARYNQTLPPLMASLKLSQKAATAGFEWENIAGVWEKFEEELWEFKEALRSNDKAHQQAELGDLLFTVVNLARWYNLDPSEALQGTNERMVQRIHLMEKFTERSLEHHNLEELDELWQRAKIHLQQNLELESET